MIMYFAFRFVNDFLRSSLHCKHQIDVLTSGNVKLSDILYDDTVFFYFIEVSWIDNFLTKKWKLQFESYLNVSLENITFSKI